MEMMVTLVFYRVNKENKTNIERRYKTDTRDVNVVMIANVMRT